MILETRIEEWTRDIENGKKSLYETLKELLTIIDDAEEKHLGEMIARDFYWEGIMNDNEESFEDLEEELEDEREKNDELQQKIHELELKISEYMKEN